MVMEGMSDVLCESEMFFFVKSDGDGTNDDEDEDGALG